MRVQVSLFPPVEMEECDNGSRPDLKSGAPKGVVGSSPTSSASRIDL